MIQPKPTFDFTTPETFIKFISGTMSSIRRKEIDNDTGLVIAKLANVLVKYKMACIIDKTRIGDKTQSDFFELPIVPSANIEDAKPI